MDKFDFPSRLQLARRNSGFASARQFAEALGIQENRYSRYERGGAEPKLRLLCRICTLLDTTPNQLLNFNDRPSAARSSTTEASSIGSPGKRGFGEREALVYDASDRVAQSHVDKSLWEFCRAYMSARVTIASKSKRGKPATALISVEVVAPLYTSLRADPVNGLAKLVTDPSYGDIPAARRKELGSLADSVLASVVGAP